MTFTYVTTVNMGLQIVGSGSNLFGKENTECWAGQFEGGGRVVWLHPWNQTYAFNIRGFTSSVIKNA